MFVQNGLDVIIGRKENTTANLFENVDHAAFSALLVSGTLNTVPIVKGMAVSALSDYNSYESVMADYKKLVQIEAIYKKQDKRRTPAKANKSLIIRLKNNIDEKIQEQNLKIKSQLTSEGFSLFAEAKKQQQILRQQAKSIIEDNSTSDKDKNVSLQKIKNIFDALENATNDFKKDYKVNIDLLSRKERNVLLDKANIELSKENKKTDPAAVKQRAELIYQTETFDKNIEKDIAAVKKLRESGIDQTFEVKNTKAEAIEAFKLALEARVLSENITKEKADKVLHKELIMEKLTL